MLKSYLLPSSLLTLTLFSGLAIAAEDLPGEPLVKGDITKAQFMEQSELRFARQDQNGDGILSVAEKEAALAKLQELMKLAGKTPSGKLGNLKPKKDTTKAQFMQRQEKFFAHLDKNGDGIISEEERAEQKERLQQFKKQVAQPAQ